jgi:hypothetical protein
VYDRSFIDGRIRIDRSSSSWWFIGHRRCLILFSMLINIVVEYAKQKLSDY